MFYTLN